MRYVEQNAIAVCKRGKKELFHLRRTYNNADFQAEHGWIYVSGLVIAIDNLLVQSLEAYARSSLRELQSEGFIKVEFANRDWASRDFDNVVLSIFEPGKVRRANEHGLSVDRLPPYIIKKPTEMFRLMKFVVDPKCFHSLDHIQNAISARFSIFNEIKHFRNFYAHQCETTAKKLKLASSDLRGRNAKRPDELLVYPRTRNRRPLLDLWTEELNEFLNILAKYRSLQ